MKEEQAFFSCLVNYLCRRMLKTVPDVYEAYLYTIKPRFSGFSSISPQLLKPRPEYENKYKLATPVASFVVLITHKLLIVHMYSTIALPL